MSYRIYRIHSRVGSQGSSADGIMHHVIRANDIYAADCFVFAFGTICTYEGSGHGKEMANLASARGAQAILTRPKIMSNSP